MGTFLTSLARKRIQGLHRVEARSCRPEGRCDDVDVHQARGPVSDAGARTHSDPNLGIFTMGPDVCLWASTQHEREENNHLRGHGSELYAAEPALISFSPFSLIQPPPVLLEVGEIDILGLLVRLNANMESVERAGVKAPY